MPPTIQSHSKRGVDSPITKKSRGSRPPISMLIFSMIHQKNRKSKLHLGYKYGFSFTNLAFRIQKQHFVYKYLVVVYKNCVSIYKLASLLTIEFLFSFLLLFYCLEQHLPCNNKYYICFVQLCKQS